MAFFYNLQLLSALWRFSAHFLAVWPANVLFCFSLTALVVPFLAAALDFFSETAVNSLAAEAAELFLFYFLL